MKICIYGAGAIGSYLGAALADAGCEVSLVARGAHLEAMKSRGLEVLTANESRHYALPCTDEPAALGAQDYVILTLKAHSVAAALGGITKLLGPETPVVTAQNGLLWWHFYALEGPWENHHLEAADPGARIWNALGPARAIGCVVYPSCELVEPGVVRHLKGTRFMLGEPDGSASDRVRKLAEAFAAGGLKAPVRKRIRDDIWFKLLGNATVNPVSVLTSATLEQMGRDEPVAGLLLTLLNEVKGVAEAFGARFAIAADKRLQGAFDVGAHKTSMLQDFERGRPLELDALVAGVTETARLVGVPTPMLDAVLALVRLKSATAQDLK